MASRLEYDALVALASIGGYATITRLSNLTGVFLLSACWVLRDRYLWQTPLIKITDSEYESIQAMIDEAVYEIMSSFAVGQIISTIADLSGFDEVLLLDGSVVDGNDYPELLSIAPVAWVSGTDITLPNMTQKGVFGENGDVGDIVGENSVQLVENEMPIHTHIQDAHSHSYNSASSTPTAAGLEPALASLVTVFPTVTGVTVATNQNAGGDVPHNNIQSSLSVYWYIVVR